MIILEIYTISAFIVILKMAIEHKKFKTGIKNAIGPLENIVGTKAAIFMLFCIVVMILPALALKVLFMPILRLFK